MFDIGTTIDPQSLGLCDPIVPHVQIYGAGENKPYALKPNISPNINTLTEWDKSFGSAHMEYIDIQQYKLKRAISRINILVHAVPHVKKTVFLKSLISDFFSPNGELMDEEASIKSLVDGLDFLIKMPFNWPVPRYDIHPDGEFSLVWSEKHKHMLAIAFSKDGTINYAYSSLEGASNKGQIKSEQFFSSKNSGENQSLISLIQKFS